MVNIFENKEKKHMIITKTPFRMSFFGGGTDMESFFRENGGAVLSTTFDKYCYVNVRHLPRFFDYSTELSYSKTERVTNIDDIQHPAIRNAMKIQYLVFPFKFLIVDYDYRFGQVRLRFNEVGTLFSMFYAYYKIIKRPCWKWGFIFAIHLFYYIAVIKGRSGIIVLALVLTILLILFNKINFSYSHLVMAPFLVPARL